jgi:hypothetical protein
VIGPTISTEGMIVAEVLMSSSDEPWVLASTVAQVFCILDLIDEKKHIVVPRK